MISLRCYPLTMYQINVDNRYYRYCMYNVQLYSVQRGWGDRGFCNLQKISSQEDRARICKRLRIESWNRFLGSVGQGGSQFTHAHSCHTIFIMEILTSMDFLIVKRDIFLIFKALYSTLLHLPPSDYTVSEDAGIEPGLLGLVCKTL